MRKKTSLFVAIAIMLLFNACNNEEQLLETKLEAVRTLSFTASIPDDDPTTRVGLEQKEDKSIALTWEAGDQLQLAFVQGATKIKRTITIKDISNGGKTAQFDILLPEEIKTGNFNLYGVFGGGGLSDANPTDVILPNNAGSALSLEDVKEREDVMLYFSLEDVDTENPAVSVTFKHLGSLFSISFKNTGTTDIENFTEARLVGIDGDDNWAFNSGVGGEIYDLETGTFQNKESAINYISFNAAGRSLASGEIITLWSWYPPLPDKMWPSLELNIMVGDAVIDTSQNSRQARTTFTSVGMSYYFYVEWNDSELKFVDGAEFGAIHIPHLYIDTDGGVPIVEKSVYLDANIRILGGNKYDDFEGRTTIRGRGNTTWGMPKKPYRFKLDQAASLLGLPAERNWVLLQNYMDPSLMCNAVAMRIGQLLEMPFTHHMIPVDVTLNGEYIGNYTFTEHKEVTESRINVGEGGWLIELDTNFDEDFQFISKNYELPVMISYPELDKMPEVEAQSIFEEMENDFNALEDLIYAESFPNNNYLDYLDAQAFVNYLIVYMLTDNEEVNHPKSTYIYKKLGGKYNMGPIWDFDWAFGHQGTGEHFTMPNQPLFWEGDARRRGTFFFSKIIEDPAIAAIFNVEWSKFRAEKYPILVEYIEEYAETIRESHAKDQVRWGQSTGSIDVYLTKLLNWLDQRAIYMDGLAEGI